MIPTITFNQAEFARTLEMIAKESSRTFPDVCNGQGLALATRALRNTVKADANKVAHELGQIATQRNVSKSGKVSFKRIWAGPQDTLAHNLVIASLRKQGKAIPSSAEIDQMAKRLRGARLKAVSFIRSGWIYAIRTLSKTVGYRDARGQRPASGEAARMTGQAKGFARPATRALSAVVECTIGNTALIEEGRSPMPVAMAGLEKAFTESVRDMKKHLEEKLNGVFQKYNAK